MPLDPFWAILVKKPPKFLFLGHETHNLFFYNQKGCKNVFLARILTLEHIQSGLQKGTAHNRTKMDFSESENWSQAALFLTPKILEYLFIFPIFRQTNGCYWIIWFCIIKFIVCPSNLNKNGRF